MSVNISSAKKGRWLRLGPGTILAVLAAIGIALAGRFTKPQSPDPNAGRVVFEADAKGHLRRVGAPSGQATAPPRLWKPDPSFLLEHAPALKLDPRQRAKIEAHRTAWLMEKARLEQEIARATSGATARVHNATPGHNVSTSQVTDNLKDYSMLSRRYDERRADYWRKSLSLLTTEQQESLSTVADTVRRTK